MKKPYWLIWLGFWRWRLRHWKQYRTNIKESEIPHHVKIRNLYKQMSDRVDTRNMTRIEYNGLRSKMRKLRGEAV